jgi:hypothetical protein
VREIKRESDAVMHTVRVTALAVVLHLINASADWTLRHRAKTAADAAGTAGTALTTGQEAGSGQGGLSGRFVWSTSILYFSRLPAPNVCRDIDLQAWACNLILLPNRKNTMAMLDDWFLRHTALCLSLSSTNILQTDFHVGNRQKRNSNEI